MKNDLQNDKMFTKSDLYNDIGEKIMDSASKLKIPYTLSDEEAWEKIQQKISSGYSPELKNKKKISILPVYYIAMAASLLLIFGIWQLFIRTQLNEISAPKGQHAEYQLPDGSRISLNAESKISFTKKNFAKNRKLTMEGEAYFEIKKGSSFTINTKLADIKILGTSFNVFARGDIFKVSCITGKIEVTSGNQSVIIVPGENAQLNNNLLTKNNERNIETIATWRNGEFNFENTPLNIVFEEIERQFNVTFVLPKNNQKFYTGGFNNSKLLDALDNVCSPMGLTYEIGRNSQILIFEKK